MYVDAFYMLLECFCVEGCNDNETRLFHNNVQRSQFLIDTLKMSSKFVDRLQTI